VPADDKQNARLIVSSLIVKTLTDMKLSYPETTAERRKELQGFRKRLEEESR
jgi:ribosome recycling factor